MFIDTSRDDLLTDFGKQTLKDRYLLSGESYQGMFRRVATAYGEDTEHAKRMYDYISKLWFMSATPVLISGGTERGLPISCFLNQVQDTMRHISDKWEENVFLGAGGGGIGTSWSNVRGLGETVSNKGPASGVIPFIHVTNAQTLAVSQGSLRRGAGAVYLDIDHPEIEEFLDIRKPSGDLNRRSMNTHHGVVIGDDFMHAVERNDTWGLISRKKEDVIKTLNARELFIKIVETRLQTGEPYIIYKDNVGRLSPEHHKLLGLEVTQSNLCAEIMLPTGLDHNQNERTAVCCLGSVNLEHYEEWKNNPQFIKDCLLFLDNVLEDFITKTNGRKGFDNARYSAANERSVGLGVMGLHSLLQKKKMSMESPLAKALNLNIFRHINYECRKANHGLVRIKGECQDSIDARKINPSLSPRRFSHTQAVAPTASISIIAGGASPCVEPWNANVFIHKTLSGSFVVRNKYLEKLLEDKDKNTEEVWASILEQEGSVQHLDFLDDIEKEVFKTAFEVDPRCLVDMAADRTPFIDQGQSINLFLPPDVHKWDLFMLHYTAWKKGIKSLYYLRSRSMQRTSYAGSVEKDNHMERDKLFATADLTNYDECLSCQ